MEYPTSPTFDPRIQEPRHRHNGHTARSSTSSTCSSSSGKSAPDCKTSSSKKSKNSVPLFSSSSSDKSTCSHRHNRRSMRHSSTSSTESCYPTIDHRSDAIDYSLNSNEVHPNGWDTPPCGCKCQSPDIMQSKQERVKHSRSPNTEQFTLRKMNSGSAAVLSVTGSSPFSSPANSSVERVNSPAKPILKKVEAIDLGDIEAKKKMERGISHATANESLVSAARTVVQHDFHHIQVVQSNPDLSSLAGSPNQGCVVETPLYTFTLPDLTSYPEDFRGFFGKRSDRAICFDIFGTEWPVELVGGHRHVPKTVATCYNWRRQLSSPCCITGNVGLP